MKRDPSAVPRGSKSVDTRNAERHARMRMGRVSASFRRPAIVAPIVALCAGSGAIGATPDGSVTDAGLIGDASSDALSPDEVPYDTCAGPLDVSGGGTFTLEVGKLHNDYPRILGPLICGGIVSSDACRDGVVTFHLDEPRDVDIVADPDNNDVWVALALRTSCDSEGPSLDTARGYGAMPLRHRALPAGTYFLFVGTDPPRPG